MNPYEILPSVSFWKSGVVTANPYRMNGIYRKKFEINPTVRIATAGSCFAQHISRHLRKNGYRVLDVEPAPPGLPTKKHVEFGYSTYSARYGNIYTTRQLAQLAREVAGEFTPENIAWQKGDRFVDAMRPAVEPLGLQSHSEVKLHRSYHIEMVEKLFKELDIFIFTLGLTETWMHRSTGEVYPTAPGTIAGTFSADDFILQNENYDEVLGAFEQFQEVITRIRGGRPFKIILTVSPVPLTATATGNHVLVATTYSKAVLRSVAGTLSARHEHIDYFPSYEIVTNPRLHSTAFEDNLRSVRDETVEFVMAQFFAEHPPIAATMSASIDEFANNEDDEAVQCEEALLEAFGK
jgi:hypothetical protein